MISVAFFRMLCHGVDHLFGGLDIDTGNIFRCSERHRSADERDIRPALCCCVSDRKAHFARRPVADKSHRVDRLIRRSGSDENFFLL